jgi:hypothetical protein
MPTKISQLEAATDITASDLMQVIDIEDTGMAPSGTNKKVTASLLANQLVPLITDNTVSGIKLQDGTVTSIKLADSAVTSIKLADSAVTSIKLADSAVTSIKIASSSITSSHIVDGTILNVDVNASAAIAGTKISPNFGSQTITGSSGAVIDDITISKGVTNNTVFGKNAFNKNVTGTYNISVGEDSLSSSTGSIENISIGRNSLYTLSGVESPPIGSSSIIAGRSYKIKSLGSDFISIGAESNTINTLFVATGPVAGSGTVSEVGGYNISIGNDNLYSGASTSYNVSIGHQALKNSLASNNLAIGNNCMKSNLSGYSNTSLGNDSLKSNTSGHLNTCVGYRAGENNTTGEKNTCVGSESFLNNIDRDDCTAVG